MVETYTIRQLSDGIGLQWYTIWMWIKQNKIPIIRVHGRPRFTKKVYDEFMEKYK